MLENDFALLPRTHGAYYAPTEAQLEKFMPFETKQEYVDWRADWREFYAELSQRIRERRTAWRAEGSDHEDKLHHELFSARGLARSMLRLRAASKERAERLYQASKEAAEVA